MEREKHKFSLKWGVEKSVFNLLNFKMTARSDISWKEKEKLDNKKYDQQHIPYYCNEGPYGVGLIDYITIGTLAYMKGSDFKHLRESLLEDFQVNKNFSRSAFFYELRSKSKPNLSVLSIRGTNWFELKDWCQCVFIWFESFVFQFLSNFIPGLSWFSRAVVADIIHFISLLQVVLPVDENERTYYLSVIKEGSFPFLSNPFQSF